MKEDKFESINNIDFTKGDSIVFKTERGDGGNLTISTKEMSNLKLNKTITKIYYVCIDEYVRVFSLKQDLEFQGWVGKEKGGVALFSDNYFINFSDIVYDLENDIEKSLIIDWYEVSTESKEGVHINYQNYLKANKQAFVAN